VTTCCPTAGLPGQGGCARARSIGARACGEPARGGGKSRAGSPDIRGFEELPFADLGCDLVTLKIAEAPSLNSPKSLLQRADQLIE
jgi:hypothetical protein